MEIYASCATEIKKGYGDKVEFRIAGPFDDQSADAITREQMKSWVSDGSIRYVGATDNIEDELR